MGNIITEYDIEMEKIKTRLDFLQTTIFTYQNELESEKEKLSQLLKGMYFKDKEFSERNFMMVTSYNVDDDCCICLQFVVTVDYVRTSKYTLSRVSESLFKNYEEISKEDATEIVDKFFTDIKQQLRLI